MDTQEWNASIIDLVARSERLLTEMRNCLDAFEDLVEANQHRLPLPHIDLTEFEGDGPGGWSSELVGESRHATEADVDRALNCEQGPDVDWYFVPHVGVVRYPDLEDEVRPVRQVILGDGDDAA